jgi:DNA-binding transcriptional regulator LsrR (DeoR family)
MTSVRDLDASILLRTCELFFKSKLATQQISDDVQAELKRLHSDFEMSREKVYELIREARRRGFFQIMPPLEAVLRESLRERFRKGNFHVVHMTELDQLATAAAQVVAELIARLHREGRDEVHVGLGAGMTSMLVARHLAIRLRAAERLPKLVFHALTSGFHVTQPHTAPVSFFGFFEAVPTEISYVGLFAAAFVPRRAYASLRKSPGVKESFDRASQIDIVLTSIGSPSHGHGDFYRFMEIGSPKGMAALKAAHWIGDVQYRPYSAKGPLLVDTEVRAVTLFEIRDLVALADKPDKHVVLVAGPCSVCRQPRADAVRPLLIEPSLRVWKTIVTDVVTARELLANSAPGRAE